MRGNWSRRETDLAGKMVSRGNWSRRETGLAGELVSRGNWSRGEIGLAGKLVSQVNLFFVTLGKIFINILVVKQITYNAKVSDNTVF